MDTEESDLLDDSDSLDNVQLLEDRSSPTPLLSASPSGEHHTVNHTNTTGYGIHFRDGHSNRRVSAVITEYNIIIGNYRK